MSFSADPETFEPFNRNPETLARMWAPPGTPGHEHRIGGLEHGNGRGNVSYDPQIHEEMVQLRAEKVARVAKNIPPVEAWGGDTGDLLVLGWGGTYGSLHTGVRLAREKGLRVSHLHLRYLNPLPSNFGDLLRRFGRVLVAELNMGQLDMLIRARFGIDTLKLNKVQGQPFKSGEVVAAIEAALQGGVQ